MKKPRSAISQRVIRENIKLYAMMLPVLVLIFIFCYIPMYGLVIAFQEYAPGSPFIGEGVRWVGLEHFKRFVTSIYFTRVVKNAVIFNLLDLAFGFTLPILFALMVDMVKQHSVKRTVLTMSYMPHFISTVIVGGMLLSFFATDGLLTNFLTVLGLERQNWLKNSDAFRMIYTAAKTWKSFGYSSILYVATLASIDPTLYEAAKIDGAGQLSRIWHVTLPGLMNIIIIKFIMAIGSILNEGSDLLLLIYSPSTYRVADTIQTYTYRYGIINGAYSYSTAAGIFIAGISIVLVTIANRVSNKVTGYGLW